MKRNVGNLDRGIRALAGIAALVAYFMVMIEGTLGIVALVVGVVLVATSAIGWCPPYALLGINTSGTKSTE